jgi:purine-binding chemotaxis protein CheW
MIPRPATSSPGPKDGACLSYNPLLPKEDASATGRPFDWDDIRRRLAAATTAAPDAAEHTRSVLEQLARRLASPGMVETPAAYMNVLTFTVGSARYAIDYVHVLAVVRLTEVTPVPATPALVVGVTNYHGQLLCLFDLRRLLGLPARPLNDLARIIVLGRHAAEFGLLADSTDDMRRLDSTDILPLASGGVEATALHRGVTRDGLIVLDGELLLNDTRLLVDQES